MSNQNNTSNHSTVSIAAKTHLAKSHLDNTIRVLHILLMLCFMGTYFTGDEPELHQIHTMFGYSFLILLGFRIVWHFLAKQQQVSTPFSWFKRVAMTRNLLQLNIKELRQQNSTLKSRGQKIANLALQFSIVLMFAMIPLTVALGYSTELTHNHDLKEIHEFFANTLLASIILHISSLIINSVLLGKISFKTMFIMQKRAVKLIGIYIFILSAVLITFWVVYLN